jgi:hypothetical protein
MGVGNIAAQFLGSGGSMVSYLYLSVRLCMCLHSPICLSSINQSIYLSVCVSISLSVYLCINVDVDAVCMASCMKTSFCHHIPACMCVANVLLMHGRMHENKFLPSFQRVCVLLMCC